MRQRSRFILFFFNDTATTEIYTLSLHDALPISKLADPRGFKTAKEAEDVLRGGKAIVLITSGIHSTEVMSTMALPPRSTRSEEHTSELQSRLHLVCRLLLEKKKNK